MKKGNVILIIVCIVLVTTGIILMPSAYSYLTKLKLNSKKIDVNNNSNNKKEVVKEKITLESDILKDLVYPVMHNDISIKDNYYKLDSINSKSLTNNDILYNAFLQIYNGYIINNNGNISFSKDYLESRIQNIFGPNTSYNITNFTVPTGSFSDYIGNFIYDSNTKNYVYEKTYTENNVIYYDLKKIYEVKTPDDNTINTLFYVAFIKVEDGKYTLYSDYNYQDEIGSGTFTTFSDIESIVDKSAKGKYQYTFRKDICNYDTYCFYEGKWINE